VSGINTSSELLIDRPGVNPQGYIHNKSKLVSPSQVNDVKKMTFDLNDEKDEWIIENIVGEMTKLKKSGERR
jgi:hypothetical protein